MTLTRAGSRHLAGLTGKFFGHFAVAVLGFVLMIVGLAMGVTMVLLPVGVVVGSIGVVTLVWGLFGHLKNEKF